MLIHLLPVPFCLFAAPVLVACYLLDYTLVACAFSLIHLLPVLCLFDARVSCALLLVTCALLLVARALLLVPRAPASLSSSLLRVAFAMM